MGDETDRMKRDKQRGMLWDNKRGRYIKTSAKELRESRALSKQHKKDRAMGRVTQKKSLEKFMRNGADVPSVESVRLVLTRRVLVSKIWKP